MKQTLFILLLGLSITLLIFRLIPLPIRDVVTGSTRAGLKILSLPFAHVIVNGKEVGLTPYQNDNLNEGMYQVKLTSEKGEWEGLVYLYPGTVSVVNREIASLSASSGEILTLEKGSGVVLTASPSEVAILVDGKAYGNTPRAIPDITPGEHIFSFQSPNFVSRDIKATVPEKMTLNISVDLALLKMNLVSSNIPIVDNLEKRLVVKKTPLGYLRVRSRPSTSSSEVTRVSDGDILIELEKLSGWYKVRVDNGKEGYVSAGYVVSSS